MLYSFDAFLCQMIVLDYTRKHLLFSFLLQLCFFWKFCAEDVY